MIRRVAAFLILLAGLAGAGAGVPMSVTAAEPGFPEPASGAWDTGETAAVRLVSAVTGTGVENQGIGTQTGADMRPTLPMGLEFQLEPGWKIYWRTPGDAGLPPVPDWSASDNVADVAMAWPVPERFEIFDIGTLGYGERVIFPLEVTPTVAGAPVRLRGTVDYLACAEICIPGRAEVALTLPAGPAGTAAQAHAIDVFRAAVPVTDAARAGLRVGDARVAADGEVGTTLSLRVESTGAAFQALDAFVEGPGGAYFPEPTIALADSGEAAVLDFPAPRGLDVAALDGTPLTVTVVDGDRALETAVVPLAGRIATGRIDAPARAVPALTAGPAPDAPGLWTILALAVLGGLILNLMPCVLPVLSLKLMSVIRKSGKQATLVRAGFLASSAGILTSFLLLGGAAIAVKQAGLSVGWGIQFQQPVFLAFMVALLTLFACNLLGFFEFRLPAALGDRAATAGAERHGLFGDFLTGAFATLLATPCTAPFLGTAVGFALGAGPVEILAVFAALGLGLALPYLAVAAFPGAVRWLPRPGPWMGWLKAVLALALAGTAVWLLTVMQVSVGWQTALSVGMLAAVAGAVLATRRLPGSRLGRAAWPVSAALALAAVAVPLTATPIQQGDGVASQEAETIAWQTFDESEIRRLVADGRTVLVDVTADWCVTCQWNKKTVLESADVAQWLNRPDVIAMRADWTRPDPAIAAYLERHGRYGIPFNIVYGPSAPGGIALPELLSRDAVFAAALSADPNADIAAVE